jgi:DNA-binding GntR family transcriptional regulator
MNPDPVLPPGVDAPKPAARRDAREGVLRRERPGTVPASGHLTKQQFVYTTLRNSIIRCELAPGSRLVIDDLAQRLRVSIIPVREALRLLQSEGLVVSVAHVGATVAPLSRTSIDDVFTTMEGLELVATRCAAQKAEPADVEVLAEIVAEMDRALDAGSPQRWADLNTRFHLSIARLADLPILQEMIQRVFDYWDRVRRYYFRDVLIHRTRIAQAEHHMILDQIARRDLVHIEQTVRQHNQGALAAYVSYLEARDDAEAKESGA